MYKNLVEVYVVNRDSHSRYLVLGVIFGLIVGAILSIVVNIIIHNYFFSILLPGGGMMVGIMIANIVWSKKN